LEQVLEKGQKWNIEEKCITSENYQGNFVEELTVDGL
jgi:hypothetical protein